MVSTPIILHYLGEERFGILRVLLDWFGHLTLIEFGLYAATMSFMAKVLGEKKGFPAALKASFKKYRNVLFMQVVAIGVFSLFFERLVPVSPGLQRETWISFFVLATSIFFIFSQIFKAQLEASQRGYMVSYVMMFQNVFYVVVSILFLLQGWSLVGQAAAYSLSIGVSLLGYVWLCREHVSLLRGHDEVFRDEAVFTKQRWSLFITELCARASLMSDNLMITFVLSTKEVTPFFITQRLIQVLQVQLQNVSGAAWPALGELYHQGEMDVFRERVLQLTELVAFLSGTSLVAIVIFNPAFIVLWTGESTFAGDWISSLAAVNSGFFALMTLWSWCFSATHKTDRITKVFVGQAVVNITLSYLLTKNFGIVGPLIAAFVGYMTVAIWWIGYEVCATFGISLWQFHRRWIVPFLLPVSVAIAAVAVTGSPRFEAWWKLAVVGGGGSIAIFGAGYYTLLSRASREFFVAKVKNSKFIKKYI